MGFISLYKCSVCVSVKNFSPYLRIPPVLLDFDKKYGGTILVFYMFKSSISKSWKAKAPSWDNICQVESSRSSESEPDSLSVNALGHSLAK